MDHHEEATQLATLGDQQNPLVRLQEARRLGVDLGLAIMMDPVLAKQVRETARDMSKAVGFVPKHCIDRPEVCTAIISRSLVWNLDPWAVAQCTYQPVEGGRVAYEAKLVQAIMEQSGRLAGPIGREYRGDWLKIAGRFVMKTGQSGKQYQARNWTDEDEGGLGVIVSARVKGETEPRSVELDLRQCWPRNSTLWATDPRTQIYYRALRMLANVAMPSVLMGVPFQGETDEDDETPVGRSSRAREINPEARARAEAHSADTPEEGIDLSDAHGEIYVIPPGELEHRCREWVTSATDEELEALGEANPNSPTMLDAVHREWTKRQAKREEQQQKPAEDPLHLFGPKVGAVSFLAMLRKGIEQQPVGEQRQRLWAIYEPRAKEAEAKVQAGDYAAIQASVEDDGR